MCTRFVYNGDNTLSAQGSCVPLSTEGTVVGFNFDIDLSVWTHTVIAEKDRDRLFIGIKMPDNQYHSFHGINRNGNDK